MNSYVFNERTHTINNFMEAFKNPSLKNICEVFDWAKKTAEYKSVFGKLELLQ